jgi:preprotein translocase subunit SecA
VPGLELALHADFGVKLPVHQWLADDKQLSEEVLRKRILGAVEVDYDAKCADIGPNMRVFEKQITLQILDTLWKEHLGQMDSLRQGIGLRGYGGKNPKQEYKRESFNLFESFLKDIQVEVIKFLSLVRIKKEEEVDSIEKQRQAEAAKVVSQSIHQNPEAAALAADPEQAAPPPPAAQKAPVMRSTPKVGRNDPCPCGSGQKYKACHGKLEV